MINIYNLVNWKQIKINPAMTISMKQILSHDEEANVEKKKKIADV